MAQQDDLFTQQKDGVRREYIARAIQWFIDEKEGQPTLQQVSELAAALWYNDTFFCKYNPKDFKRRRR
jgi:hypothetical protein